MAKYAYRGRREGLYTKKKKRHRGLIIFLVVLGILAAACFVFVSFFMGYYRLSGYVSDEQVMRETVLMAGNDGGAALRMSASLDGTSDASGGISIPVIGDVYNLLLVGVDRRDESWSGNADSMILLSVDRKSRTVHMISFMRDLYADIPGYGVAKLNAACAHGGCPLLVQTIESNYQIDIDNYVSIDFGGMIAIIDAIGGVQLEVSDEEASLANGLITDMASLRGESPDSHYFGGGGTYLCDGYQATTYSRIRYVGNSDYERTERQRTVMTQVVSVVRGMDLTELNTFAREALPHLTHNIDAVTMLLLLPQVPSIAKYDIAEDRVPYDGLYTSEGEILVPDMDATRARLRETIYGE